MLMVACLEMTSGERGVSSDGLSFDRSCHAQGALIRLRKLLATLYTLSARPLALLNGLYVSLP